jgi:hypothetical protein
MTRQGFERDKIRTFRAEQAPEALLQEEAQRGVSALPIVLSRFDHLSGVE